MSETVFKVFSPAFTHVNMALWVRSQSVVQPKSTNEIFHEHLQDWFQDVQITVVSAIYTTQPPPPYQLRCVDGFNLGFPSAEGAILFKMAWF